MKVATVCYPVCLLIKYLVQLDRVFAKLGTVFEDAVPTPVCFRQLFVATLGLVSLERYRYCFILPPRRRNQYSHTPALYSFRSQASPCPSARLAGARWRQAINDHGDGELRGHWSPRMQNSKRPCQISNFVQFVHISRKIGKSLGGKRWLNLQDP